MIFQSYARTPGIPAIFLHVPWLCQGIDDKPPNSSMLRPVPPMSSAGQVVPRSPPSPPPQLARNAWHHGVARHGATLWQRVAAVQWPWQVVPMYGDGDVMKISWSMEKHMKHIVTVHNFLERLKHNQVELASRIMGYHVIMCILYLWPLEL